MRLARALALALLLAVLGWGYFQHLSLQAGVAWDDGLYLTLARGLAEGKGYRVVSYPGEPFEAGHPPLYALLLAPIWIWFPNFPENLWVFKGVNVLMALAAVLACYGFVTRGLGASRAKGAVTAVLFAMSSAIWTFLDVTMSEITYMVTSLGALLLSERWLRRDRELPTGQLAVLALCLALPALTRTIGIMVPAAVGLWLLVQRRLWDLTRFGALAGTFLLPWQAWTWWIVRSGQPVYFDYMGFLADATAGDGPEVIRHTLVSNTTSTFRKALPIMLVPVLPVLAARWALGALTPLLLLATLATCFGGAFRTLRAGLRVWHLYVLLYVGLVLVFPWPPERYLASLTPLALYALVEGAAWLAGPGRLLRARQALALALIVLVGSWGSLELRAHLRRPWPPAVLATETLTRGETWLTAIRRAVAVTPPDAVVLGESEFAIYLITNRHTGPWYVASTFDEAQLAGLIRKSGERPLYVLVPRGAELVEPPAPFNGWPEVARTEPGGFVLYAKPANYGKTRSKL